MRASIKRRKLVRKWGKYCVRVDPEHLWKLPKQMTLDVYVSVMQKRFKAQRYIQYQKAIKQRAYKGSLRGFIVAQL